LDKLDVSGLTNLKQLYCANNARVLEHKYLQKEKKWQIKTAHGLFLGLNVKGCVKLEELDCAENSLLNS